MLEISIILYVDSVARQTEFWSSYGQSGPAEALLAGRFMEFFFWNVKDSIDTFIEFVHTENQVDS